MAMNSQKRILSLGVLSLAIGGALAFLLRPEAAGDDAVASVPQPRTPEGNKSRFAELRSMPAESGEADQYNQERWGHLADNVLVMPHADTTGDIYFQDTKVFVGLDGKGNKKYLRAIHRPVYAPNLKRLTKADMKELPTIQVDDWKPGPMMEKLKNIKHAKTPGDLPENMQHLHPLYEGNADQDEGSAEPSAPAKQG
jgi:hypothetical protein